MEPGNGAGERSCGMELGYGARGMEPENGAVEWNWDMELGEWNRGMELRASY